MKRASTNKRTDGLRPEYDLSKLKGGVRGKYYQQAIAGTNLVLIEPELAEVCPDTESVNRALRLLADTAEAAAGPCAEQTAQADYWKTSRLTIRRACRKTPEFSIFVQESPLFSKGKFFEIDFFYSLVSRLRAAKAV